MFSPLKVIPSELFTNTKNNSLDLIFALHSSLRVFIVVIKDGTTCNTNKINISVMIYLTFQLRSRLRVTGRV